VGLFATGLVIGFSVAVSIGPMALLCIRRTLVRGIGAGLATGLGIAIADSLYALVAALGLTAISSTLVEYQTLLGVTGGVFLVYIGAQILRSPLPQRAAPETGRGITGAFASALGLTLTNPMTILFFAAVFAGFGLTVNGNYLSGTLFVIGVLLGSSAWWMVLTATVNAIRRRLDTRLLAWLNRISGGLIIAFAILVLARAVL
jgi:threonine/homoserine/homoserine lactone efflux protein